MRCSSPGVEVPPIQAHQWRRHGRPWRCHARRDSASATLPCALLTGELLLVPRAGQVILGARGWRFAWHSMSNQRGGSSWMRANELATASFELDGRGRECNQQIWRRQCQCVEECPQEAASKMQTAHTIPQRCVHPPQKATGRGECSESCCAVLCMHRVAVFATCRIPACALPYDL